LAPLFSPCFLFSSASSASSAVKCLFFGRLDRRRIISSANSFVRFSRSCLFIVDAPIRNPQSAFRNCLCCPCFLSGCPRIKYGTGPVKYKAEQDFTGQAYQVRHDEIHRHSGEPWIGVQGRRRNPAQWWFYVLIQLSVISSPFPFN